MAASVRGLCAQLYVRTDVWNIENFTNENLTILPILVIDFFWEEAFTFVGSAFGISSIMVSSAELLDGHFMKKPQLRTKIETYVNTITSVFVFFGDHDDV